MPQCSKCTEKAIYNDRYRNIMLCKDHFFKLIENKVERFILNNRLVEHNDRILLSLSGGKDSTAMLYILNDIFKDRDDIKLSAITVDQGIKNYRKVGINIVKEQCRKLKIPLTICSFKDEFGTVLDDIAKRVNPTKVCNFCSELRRFLVSNVGKKMKATKIAVGYTLDNAFLVIINSVIRSNMFKATQFILPKYPPDFLLNRFKFNYPIEIFPMRLVSEEETSLYVKLKNLQIDHGKCPYPQPTKKGSHGFWRLELTAMMQELDKRFPNIKIDTLNNFQKNFISMYEEIINRDGILDARCGLCDKPLSGYKNPIRSGLICQECMKLAGINLKISRH
jgi:tRNA(Ile)-lysidine synthase TilS/MesJ